MPYKYNAITGELDLVLRPGGGVSVIEIDTDSGSAFPDGAGVINLLGGTGIATSGAGNTVIVNLDVPVTVPNGGTGAISFTANSLLLGNGVSPLSALGAASDGQIPIGSTGNPPVLAVPVSTNGSITITPGAGSLDFEVTGGQAATSLQVDAATAPGTDPVLPSASGEITITGGQVAAGTVGANVIRTHSAALNSLTVEIQRSTTSATSDANDNGVCHFSSTNFSVDANGFVQLSGIAGFLWNEVTATSENMLVNNGYIANNVGLVTLTLPATAALGTIIRVAGKGAGGWSIAQNAGQTIHFGTLSTTPGAGGSLASNDDKDCVELLCITANTDFEVLSSIGVMTIV